MGNLQRFVRFLRLISVEPVLFVYMFCLFLSFPVLQQLTFKKICLKKFNGTICSNLHLQGFKTQNEQVASGTSQWILYQSIALAVPSIFASLVYGSWSDRVGRRMVMILPPVGNVLLNINYLLNVHFFSLDVNYLLIGIIISGFFGGFATVILSVFAYISDISSKTDRTLRVGLLESMIFFGATAGNLIGGVILQYSGFMAAFGLALALNICMILYICFILQESYHPPDRYAGGWSLVMVHEHFKKGVDVIVKRRPNSDRLHLVVLLFIVFAFNIIAFSGYNDVAIIYSKASPINFSPSMIGYYLATGMAIRGVGVVIGIPVMSKGLQWTDYTIAIVGMMCWLVMFIFTGFASSFRMMFVSTIFNIGGGVPVPSVRSVMSKLVEPDEQGTMFAAVAFVEVLFVLLASVIFNNVYSYTLHWHRGFTFFLIAGLLLVPIGTLLWLYIVERRKAPYVVMSERTSLPVSTDDSVNNSVT